MKCFTWSEGEERGGVGILCIHSASTAPAKFSNNGLDGE